MTALCIRRREGKLIDARFVRPLVTKERDRMERHLEACTHCRERYRKLHLAERVAAGSVDEPSAFELERIAGDLGLLDEETARPRFNLGWLSIGGSVLVAASMAAIFLVPPAEDGLVARGGETGISFSVYAVENGEQPRLLRDGDVVRPDLHLKLRASGGEIGAVHVVLVDGSGTIEHVALGAPANATVPGAVSLDGLANGPLTAYFVVTQDFTLERLRDQIGARAPPEDVAAAAKGFADRIELVIGGAP